MRLRRFLMTEPTETSLSQWLGVVGDGHPGTGTEKMPRISLANSEALAARAYGTERRASADVGYRSLQSIGHRGFRNPETATEANGWQLPSVHHSIDGHLRHAHQFGDLSHRKEPDIWNLGHPTYPFLDLCTL